MSLWDRNLLLTKKNSGESSLASEINVSKLKQGSNRAGKDFGAGTRFVSDAGDELRRERRTNTTATTLLLRSPRWVSGLLGLVPSVRQTCEILLPACPTGMITVSDNQYQGLTIRESCVKLRWPQVSFPLTSYGFDLVDKGPQRRPTKPTLGGQLAQALALRAAMIPDPVERAQAKALLHTFLQTCKDAVKPSLVSEAWALNKADSSAER